MAPSRWFERVPDPITQAQAALHGWDSPFTADSVVRYYQGRTLADWQRDTGDTAGDIVIVAGIGTLVLDALGTRFSPVSGTTTPSRLPDDLIAKRMATCMACPRYRADIDRCGMCGCSFVIAERVRSSVARCPECRWQEPSHP